MFRTSYSFVGQARPAVPNSMGRIWYGQYNPTSCSYAPFYVSAEHIPAAYTRYVASTRRARVVASALLVFPHSLRR
jgi:dipeptidase